MNNYKFKIFIICLICLCTFPLSVSALESSSSTVSTQNVSEIKEKLVALLPKTASLEEPNLFLINKQNPLASEPDFEIYYDEWGNSYNIVIVEPLHEMMVAAAQDGFYYTIVSGYRSMDEQAYNRQSRIDSYLSEGHSHEEANILTDQFYAPHNASEHTSGLALDLVGIEWSEGLHTDYAYQPSAQWLANNAHRFGFILRYMEGKSDITGYHYEPWHFRYVGKEHATFMYKHGLTLEEYLELIAYRGKKLP